MHEELTVSAAPSKRRLVTGRKRLPIYVAVILVMLFGFQFREGPARAGVSASPSLTGSVSNAMSLSGAAFVAVSGNYAYTAAYFAGTITVVDISNPANPTVVGQSPYAASLQNASDMVISGHYAYVVSQNRNGTSGSGVNDDGTGNALTILDISNPTAPTIVGTLHDSNLLFGAHGVAVSGSYVYVAAQGCLSGQPCPNPTAGNSIVVIDASNPAIPQIVGWISNSNLPSQWSGTSALQHACGIAVSGNYAYVTASYSARLTVVDISNPVAPKIVASIQNRTSGSTLPLPVDVTVTNGYAYVVNEGSSGPFTVVDVHNPLSPFVVGSLSSAANLNGAYRVAVRGNFAYVAAAYAATMNALDISDPANPRIAGTYTNTTLLNRTVGVALDPTSQYAISTSPWRSTEFRTLYPPFPFQPGGPVNTGTVNVIQIEPAPINVTISSSPPDTSGSAAANFAFQPNDDVSTTRCQLDGGAFGLCTTPISQAYNGLALGTHTFTVEAIDAAGNTATASDTWTIVAQAPGNTQPPQISGTAAVGQQLSANPGVWTGAPAPAFTYQWQRCDNSGNNCNPIQGATNATYTITNADTGSTLEVAVTGTNNGGTAQAVSATTPVVIQNTQAPANTQAPQISGTVAVGQQLQANPGTWTGSPAPTFTYQWQGCSSSGTNCSAIQGATNATYTITNGDVGTTLRVVVTGTNSAGSAQAASAVTVVVPQPSSTGLLPAAPPTTPVLDNFNRANGSVGSNWTNMHAGSFSTMNIANNVAVNPGSASQYAWNYWNPATYGPDVEAYATVANYSGNDTLRIGARVSANSSTYSGYFVSITATGVWSIIRITNATVTTLASGVTDPISSGDQIGIRIVGSVITALHRTAANGWVAVLTYDTANDSTRYTAAGSLSFEFRTSTIDDFGGGLVAQAPANTQLPQVTGTATVGQQLQANAGSWTGNPAPTFTYQWQRCDNSGNNCSPVPGATNATFTITNVDVGSTLNVVVAGTNSAGNAQATSAATAVVPQPPQAPTNTQAPQISGTAAVGQQLQASAGTWTGYPAPTLSYQWQRCDSTGNNCNAIQGASSATYSITSADAVSTLNVVVTGSNSSGSAQAASTATSQVVQAPANRQLPQITGTATVGQQLQASPGTWTGTPAPTFTYQWQDCDNTGNNCNPIQGATNASYTITNADGSTLNVVVSGSNSAGSAQATSAATAAVSQPQPPSNTQAPQILGTAAVGQQLRADPGTWTGSPAPLFTYQWQRCDNSGNNCNAIQGASDTTYTIINGDAGSTLAVAVTGTNSGGSAQATSTVSPEVAQAPANTQAPQISGTVAVGQQLLASPGTWTGSPAPILTYQWERCDNGGNNCNPIQGAGDSFYTITNADAGSTLNVIVIGTNSAGNAQAIAAATAVVPQPPQSPANTQPPQISGTATVGQQLQASPGTWTGYPAPTFTYQWQRCDSTGNNCNPIQGTSNTSYTITSGDTGSTLDVVVTGTNGSGSAQAASTATSQVAQAPANTQLPQISGTAAVGQQLQADPGTWTGSPAPTFTYQWQDCDSSGNNCNPIQGATNAAYTITNADAGSTLVVAVTGTNSAGNARATSGATTVVPQPLQPPANTQLPQISGTATVGQQLQASPGTWTGNPAPTFTYQWQRCDNSGNNCGPIQGATNATYTIAGADAGSTLNVVVTGTNSNGSAQATSTATSQVAQAPANTQAPQITGTAAVGQQLQANPGNWTGTPAPIFAYQWQRCDNSGNNCGPIQGATNAAYTIANADIGSTLAVAVTGTNSAGSAQAASAATTVVPQPQQAPANTQVPQISGTATVGQQLQATPGTWTGNPAPTFTYQWQRCGSGGNNCSAIQGASNATYTVSKLDIGSTLAVAVTGTDSSATCKPPPPPPESFPTRRRRRCWTTSTAPTARSAPTGRTCTPAPSRP